MPRFYCRLPAQETLLRLLSLSRSSIPTRGKCPLVDVLGSSGSSGQEDRSQSPSREVFQAAKPGSTLTGIFSRAPGGQVPTWPPRPEGVDPVLCETPGVCFAPRAKQRPLRRPKDHVSSQGPGTGAALFRAKRHVECRLSSLINPPRLD